MLIKTLIAHTDPSLDFFEVLYPVKYNIKYAHYLNQRIFYEPVEVAEEEKKKPENPNAELFEEKKGEESDEESKVPEYKKIVLSYQEVKKSQTRLRSYPPVLLHTLFHEDLKYELYRQKNLSELFFFGDEVKALGNEAYHKGDYYTALDFYEHCVTLYSWLELRDPKTKERHKFTILHSKKKTKEEKKAKGIMSLEGETPPQVRKQVRITDDSVANVLKELYEPKNDTAAGTEDTGEVSEDDDYKADELLDKENRKLYSILTL